MTLKPIWRTPAGSLGEFVQGVNMTPLVLDVQNADTVEVISKVLPNGIKLDPITKTLSGVPFDLGITKTFDFVVRASVIDGGVKNIQDRTFSMTITNDARPTLLTAEGALSLGPNDENFILNNTTVNFQFLASTITVPAGQKLRYYLEEGIGELPPGLKLSDTGLLYGTVKDDLELDYKVVQGSYDKDYYDANPYDYGSPIETGNAISKITSGRIESVDVTYGGNGYLLDPQVIVGGSVGTITITNGGYNYTTAPDVVFSNPPVAGGIVAKGYAELTGQTISRIVVTDPGTGYDVAPTITFKNQNTGFGATTIVNLRPGSGAELLARVSDGRIVKVDVVNAGSGYAQPPLISFGLPTAGSRIISKTYRFRVTVSNGVYTDSKNYVILVKSENALRVDTTFILSDTVDFDSSRTYIQPPIWISPSKLPVIKGDNNYIYDLELFDPTPDTGKVYFTLMDYNFDGTESLFGPINTERNRISFGIKSISLTVPVGITTVTEHDFADGDRVRILNIVGTTELNNNVYFVKRISAFELELYSDTVLINSIDGRFFKPYISSGRIHPEENFLKLDSVGGEINGFIPYQPDITRTYKFTVKAERILEEVEVASSFKEFEITVEGNIEGKITYSSPTEIGTLKPNEQSLLKINASSSLPSASVNFQVIPGYGRIGSTTYVELNLKEANGNILIDGYGYNPILTFEKGQTYKINMSVSNFTISFRNLDGTYYNTGLRHSSGGVGLTAQEKSSGYVIFTPSFDNATKVRLVYTNDKKDGLYIGLKKYNLNTRAWDRLLINAYFTEYDAYVNNKQDIDANVDVFAVFLNYTKIQFEIKKYNKSTLTWDLVNIPLVKPTDPVNNNFWIDMSETNFGVLNFRYDGLSALWTKNLTTGSIKTTSAGLPVVYELPDNSEGVNRETRMFNDNGTFKVIRRVNGVWKILENLSKDDKTAFDPNVFFNPHYRTAPKTNLEFDVWFKYTSLFNGLDKEIPITLKSLDNLPSALSVTLDGEIVGKISPNTGNTYKSYYTANRLYVPKDVVTFDDNFYICINQYRSLGNWYSETDNWQTFTYTTRTATSIDSNAYGAGKFSIHGTTGDDGTTLDNLLRFRIRAKDTQNVSYSDKDFNIKYDAISSVTLTNVYLQPFLDKVNRDSYFNFITNTNIFLNSSLYRPEDPNFGVQRIPKMLLLGGLENTTADRYVSAVQRNYYDRPLYFGDLKVAIAKSNDNLEYEVIYVEINDPSEINGTSVRQSIKLDFDYDPLTVDYSKIRVDGSGIVITDTGLDTIYPSSITLMQAELKKVTLAKTDSVLLVPTYEEWGGIVGSATEFDDWGTVTERVAITDDFLSVIQTLSSDDRYRPLWMNTSQDGTGNPIGYVKAVPICYVKPGESAKILKLIEKSKFDFKSLNFKIDRIIIQNPQGETGDKYIKFINREII